MATQNDPRSDKLVLTQTGSGGLNELSGLLSDSKASFGYARVSYSNDKESQREKFILIVWIGKDTKIMRKAKVRFFSSFTLFTPSRTSAVTPGPDIRSLRGRQVCFEGVLYRSCCERTGRPQGRSHRRPFAKGLPCFTIFFFVPVTKKSCAYRLAGRATTACNILHFTLRMKCSLFWSCYRIHTTSGATLGITNLSKLWIVSPSSRIPTHSGKRVSTEVNIGMRDRSSPSIRVAPRVFS